MKDEEILPGMEELSREEVGEGAKREVAPELKRRFEYINRAQTVLSTIDVEGLIPQEHPARAIWEFLGRLNLSGFSAEVQAYEGERGRAALDPRLLVSLWVYSYSRGIASAREIERLCEQDRAYQWLTGMKPVNHHSLSDFRVKHQGALKNLFVEILAVLSQEGLVSLERVMTDGTKIKARSSRYAFQGEKKIKWHLEEARRHVEAMEEQAGEEMSARVMKAQQRAARESKQRLEAAMEEFKKLQKRKPGVNRDKLRVSESEPEARKMKQVDGGYAPSYNVQITTEHSHRIIVDVGLSQSGADSQELGETMARVEENTGQLPRQVVADGGYQTGDNIKKMGELGVDFITPVNDSRDQLKHRGIDPEFGREAFIYDADKDCYQCPAGQVLSYKGVEQRGGKPRYRYQANATVCGSCVWKPQCCPQTTRGRSLSRWEYEAEVAAHKAKMQTPEAQEIYKQRAATAEFPIAWIKEKLKLRRFNVRGASRAAQEALWAAITYNIQQWTRLVWSSQFH